MHLIDTIQYKPYDTIHDKYKFLHVLAPECHLLGVYRHKGSKFIDSMKMAFQCQNIRFGPYHELCFVIGMLLYFVKCICCFILGVTGGTDQTSGECSLGQTIPI